MLGLVLLLLSPGVALIQAQETLEALPRDPTESREGTFLLPRPTVLSGTRRQPVLAPLIDGYSPATTPPRTTRALPSSLPLPVEVAKS